MDCSNWSPNMQLSLQIDPLDGLLLWLRLSWAKLLVEITQKAQTSSWVEKTTQRQANTTIKTVSFIVSPGARLRTTVLPQRSSDRSASLLSSELQKHLIQSVKAELFRVVDQNCKWTLKDSWSKETRLRLLPHTCLKSETVRAVIRGNLADWCSSVMPEMSGGWCECVLGTLDHTSMRRCAPDHLSATSGSWWCNTFAIMSANLNVNVYSHFLCSHSLLFCAGAVNQNLFLIPESQSDIKYKSQIKTAETLGYK